MFTEKKSSMNSLSVFPGRADHPCLKSPYPTSGFKLIRVEKKSVSSHYTETFSCPHSSYTWKSYAWYDPPSGSTSEIYAQDILSLQIIKEINCTIHTAHILLCPAGCYLYYQLHLLNFQYRNISHWQAVWVETLPSLSSY